MTDPFGANVIPLRPAARETLISRKPDCYGGLLEVDLIERGPTWAPIKAPDMVVR